MPPHDEVGIGLRPGHRGVVRSPPAIRVIASALSLVHDGHAGPLLLLLNLGFDRLQVLDDGVDILRRDYLLLLLLVLPRQLDVRHGGPECALPLEPPDHLLQLGVRQDLVNFQLDLDAEGTSPVQRLQFLDHLLRSVIG